MLTPPALLIKGIETARTHNKSERKHYTMTNDFINDRELKRAITTLKKPGELFEVRIIEGKTVYSGYFKSADKAITEIARQRLNGKNVFITLNKVNDACYSRAQHDCFIKIYREPTTGDKEIDRYEWLLIDLDPERPAGISSTATELDAAKEKAAHVFRWLNEKGFKRPLAGMSGNGCHLLYKIDIENTDENKSIIENVLKALDVIFSDEVIKIDTSVFNPARISKLYGTMAQKGASTDERPHRMSVLTSVPENIEITAIDKLKEVAAIYTEMLPPAPATKQSYSGSYTAFDVYKLLNENGINYREVSGKGYTKLILEECVFNPDHKAPDAMVTISDNGALGYKCLHNSCSGNHWREFRLKLDPAAYDRPINDYKRKENIIYSQTEETNAEIEETASSLNGLLTYESAVNTFIAADDKFLELPKFPEFSKQAKIKTHDSVIIAADTGAGKSSLALNFIDNLNDRYPVIYFNLEMDELTVLQRLVSIRTGIELDRIEGYKHDEQTAAVVNIALKEITARQPLQVIQDKYKLTEIESEIKKATVERETPTIIVIDHSLLVTTDDSFSRYERFTQISEELRRISRLNNVIMFVLLQQNRSGKDDDKRPVNSSLKESGSWENDATHIIFLWYDAQAACKKLLLTKNRGGITGDFNLEYYSTTQFYKESKEQTTAARSSARKKKSKRDQERDQLQSWYEKAYIATGGNVTLYDMAEAAGTTTAVIKRRLKEYGGYIVEGEQYDAAGIDTDIEEAAYIRLTIGEAGEFETAGEVRTIFDK